LLRAKCHRSAVRAARWLAVALLGGAWAGCDQAPGAAPFAPGGFVAAGTDAAAAADASPPPRQGDEPPVPPQVDAAPSNPPADAGPPPDGRPSDAAAAPEGGQAADGGPAADGGAGPPIGEGSCALGPAATAAELRDWTALLSGAMPLTIEGRSVILRERFSPAARRDARLFLRAEYERLGYAVSEHAYATGVNLIAERAGQDDQVVIVGAHYDSVSAAVAGADDDASGVVAGLAVARALAGCALGHGLRFLAFDEEERGLRGSRAYARSLQEAGEAPRVIANVNLEMLGYDSNDDGKALLVDCDRPDTAFVSALVLESVTALGLDLSFRKFCTRASDHAAFWEINRPAVVISQEFFLPGADRNPCYHRACDVIGSMNFAYMAKLTALVTTVTSRLADAR
jgi:hypothetical protein